ncbi:MAG: class I SAM-dependent methyltransferase [Candidatus Zixiibacteriota bacterium]
MNDSQPNRTGGYVDQPFVAELYDQVPLHGQRGDTGFYVECAKEFGEPVLELGCGTGRILLEIARAGIDITGLDLSEPMLKVCRKRVGAEPADVQERVTLLEACMTDFDLGRRFKLITVPFRAFQHLVTVDDQLNCLAAVRDHLDDDGRFVVDLFNPSLAVLTDEKYKQEWGEEPDFSLSDGTTVRRRFLTKEVDLHNQIVEAEIIYYKSHPDGHTEKLAHNFPIRYSFRYEMEHLLVRSGLQVEALYAGFQRQPFGSVYPGELIFVARRSC